MTFFLIEIQPNMTEQEKKQQRIYYFLNVDTKPKRIFEIIEVSFWPLLRPGRNDLFYAIWGVLENRTNATYHPNIGSLKIVIEEEWNKIFGIYFAILKSLRIWEI